MRLRNKKTGEIVTIGKELGDDFDGVGLMLWVDHVEGSELDDYKIYGSIDELNEEWEDYKPTEPLIEDEKVRKFVRDWAEHWGIGKVVIRFIDNNRIDLIGFPGSTGTGREIDIQRTAVRNEITCSKRYTITELCGEEKE